MDTRAIRRGLGELLEQLTRIDEDAEDAPDAGTSAVVVSIADQLQTFAETVADFAGDCLCLAYPDPEKEAARLGLDGILKALRAVEEDV